MGLFNTVVGKTGDIDLVSKLIADRGIDTVMHFAAHAIVPESVANPLKYYAGAQEFRNLSIDTLRGKVAIFGNHYQSLCGVDG